MNGESSIRRRDELLQVLYWLAGEGLASAASARELIVFLPEETEAVLNADLLALAAAGLVEPAGEQRFRLTQRGREEGARRFADDFAELTRQAHGACSDPDCDCHVNGPQYCTHATDV